MVAGHCVYCDIYSQELDGAHVRDKVSFSEFEIDDGYDRIRNIIPLCKEHHREFDRGELGIVVHDRNLHFTKYNCCGDGICLVRFKTPYINWLLSERGLDGMKIDPAYIQFKNSKIVDLGHRLSVQQFPRVDSILECTRDDI